MKGLKKWFIRYWLYLLALTFFWLTIHAYKTQMGDWWCIGGFIITTQLFRAYGEWDEYRRTKPAFELMNRLIDELKQKING
jgi:hypothetical protein